VIKIAETELPIYTVAELWESESGISRMIWLHRMARGIVSPDYGAYPLLLGRPQLPGESIVAPALMWLAEAVRRSEPSSLVWHLEPLKISRDSFQEWCAPLYPLPAFWFGVQRSEPSRLGAQLKELQIDQERENVINDAVGRIQREIMSQLSKSPSGSAVDYAKAFRLFKPEGVDENLRGPITDRLKKILKFDSHGGRSSGKNDIVVYPPKR